MPNFLDASASTTLAAPNSENRTPPVPAPFLPVPERFSYRPSPGSDACFYRAIPLCCTHAEGTLYRSRAILDYIPRNSRSRAVYCIPPYLCCVSFRSPWVMPSMPRSPLASHRGASQTDRWFSIFLLWNYAPWTPFLGRALMWVMRVLRSGARFSMRTLRRAVL